MLLYERFLGRPFAGHRDSVSELVGDVMESAIEDVLSAAGISYRKTKRAASHAKVALCHERESLHSQSLG
jgi:hypothetical protein